MSSVYFSREEAVGKIGTVVKALPRAREECAVLVEWHLPRTICHSEFMAGDIGLNLLRKGVPVADQFSRPEYEALLKVVADY